MNGREMKSIHLKLDSEIHKVAKIEADLKGITVQELIRWILGNRFKDSPAKTLDIIIEPRENFDLEERVNNLIPIATYDGFTRTILLTPHAKNLDFKEVIHVINHEYTHDILNVLLGSETSILYDSIYRDLEEKIRNE